MCVYAAEAAEPARGDADAFEIRKLDAFIIADHDVLNVALAIDEGADLPACFVREFAQLPGEFRGDDLIGRYAPGIQLFYAPQLIWF